MADDKRCNGWTNYETWNVALWIDNDQWLQSHWQDKAQDCYDGAEGDETLTREEQAAYDLADSLKNQFEEDMPALQGCYADLLNAALSVVNWDEIAKGMIEACDKVTETEAE